MHLECETVGIGKDGQGKPLDGGRVPPKREVEQNYSPKGEEDMGPRRDRGHRGRLEREPPALRAVVVMELGETTRRDSGTAGGGGESRRAERA